MDYSKLKAGDIVSFSGDVYTARDAAHLRIVTAMKQGQKPPFPLKGAVIYYAGPTPAKPNELIGSCGPTSSTRMDDYTPYLLDQGLSAMIGKGKRNPDVIDAMVRNGAVYFCAVGGAAALIKKHIVACEEIAYPDLGCEAVRKLTFKDLPLIVGIDAKGNSVLN